MQAAHTNKIQEIVDSLAAAIRIDAERLGHSGAIDTSSYNENEYVLAKILVTVSARCHVDDFAPLLNKQHMKAVRNLEHF